MGDIILTYPSEELPEGTQVRYRDMGDGTYALVVAMGETIPLNVVLELPDTDTPLLTDEQIGSLVTMRSVHHEIHDGETFAASHYNAALANTSSISLQVVAGALELHLTMDVACGGNAVVSLIESPNVTVAGGAVTIYNMNRNSAKIPTAQASHTPIYTGGTTILQSVLPGGRGPNSSGGTARNDTEWVFHPDYRYVILLTNVSGAANPASIFAQWYEVAQP